MIGALIIVFREVIEAGLIVGIVLAATHGVRGRNCVRPKASALIGTKRQRYCDHLLTILLKEVP